MAVSSKKYNAITKFSFTATADKKKLRRTNVLNSIIQESILPNFVCLHFPIFAVTLFHFATTENTVISIKLQSTVEKSTFSVLRRKKFGRVDSRLINKISCLSVDIAIILLQSDTKKNLFVPKCSLHLANQPEYNEPSM